MTNLLNKIEGILPLNKPAGFSSFDLIKALRRGLKVKKIGHSGTLDPFARGVLVTLIGSSYTKFADFLQNIEKEYIGKIRLGAITDTLDLDGRTIYSSSLIPRADEVEEVVSFFQGEILQRPPMFSAKKLNGKKLYEYARKGEVVKRDFVKINLRTSIEGYSYPYLKIRARCSKGTYIRALAADIGALLGCGGYLEELIRLKNGPFQLKDCFDGQRLFADNFNNREISAKIVTYENLYRLKWVCR